jgi:U4/U6 small nuclear ribonucleoprotein PRP31
MTKVPLSDILPASVVMVVTVMGSSSSAAPLSLEDLGYVIEGCNEAQYLADCKASILRFVESRMSFLAPNISAILGTTVAAQLMGASGGLNALSNTPSCNIKV